MARPSVRSGMLATTVIALVFACGPSATSAPAPVAETCRLNVPPREVSSSTSPALPRETRRNDRSTIEARPSRIVARVDVKLGPLQRSLEAKVRPRLAERRNHGIGLGGHLNYTVDRGPLTMSVEGDALVLRTDIRAHAEACRGDGCYASCDPQGRATATVPLRLSLDYRFAASRVTFAFERGCEVRALGGLVKVDVTPTLRSQLDPVLRDVEQEIDRQLREEPVRARAEQLWTEMGKTRPLPLGACVVTNPRSIVQGPVRGEGDILQATFAVVAYPELRTRCSEATLAAGAPPPALPALRPLPPLVQQPSMPPSDELLIGLVSPLTTVASSLESTEPFDAGGVRARVGHVTLSPAGGRGAGDSGLAEVDISLRGEACGSVAVRSAFEWTSDGTALHLAAPAFLTGERERALAASLRPDALLRGITTTMRTPSPVVVASLKELIPSLAQAFSPPDAGVRATVSEVTPTTAVVRDDDLVAMVVLRGNVHIAQK